MNAFSEGCEVKYKGMIGTIKFISPEYLTMCIHRNSNPLKDVCVVVHSQYWDDVELVSGNRNSED